MNGIVIGALIALGGMQQTDTTFAAQGVDQLRVETLGGSITVDVWDRDEVRVRAEHSRRTHVEISRRRGAIRIEGEARRGPANMIEFHITVPRLFGLSLEANYGDVTIEGADGPVDVETVQGDIVVYGGRGTIRVSNTMGNILVTGAQGRIDIESSAADVRVVDSGGEIYAETAGGTIVLENVTATAVDVGSTGGRVYFEGALDPEGTYFFGAHGGSITIVIPEDAGASLNVATMHGSITSNLTGQSRSLKSGERHSFEVGGGGALVEAETYGGRIRLLRKGSEGAGAPDPRDGAHDGDRSRARAPRYPTRADVFGRDFAIEVASRVVPTVEVAVAPVVDVGVDVALDVAMDLHLESLVDRVVRSRKDRRRGVRRR